MKKLLCIVMSLIAVATSALSFLSYAVATDIDEISAEEFAKEISAMVNASAMSEGAFGSEYGAGTDEFKTSRLIVKSKYRIDTMDTISVICGYDDLWVLQFKSPDDARNAYNRYVKDNKIDYVEIDKEICALFSDAMSSDAIIYSDEEEHSYLSWGPEYIGIDKLNNNISISNTEISNTIVAVIDTGVDPDHPFFKGRVLPTRINTSTSGIRNNSMDDNGHGTQVAGVIIDSTMDNVFVQPYKVLDSHGAGTIISLAAGINCALEDGVDVINISVGFEEDSAVLKNAIDNAEINNIPVIAASGNDGTTNKFYPASYDNVLKITAINQSGIVTNFSTYDNGVDFAAPGFEITTTNLGGGYIKTRGTSVAAPFVTAVAAAIHSYRPDALREEIIDIIENACVQISEHNSSIKYGRGIIRAPEHPANVKLKDIAETPYFSHQTALSQTELDIEIFCDTPGAKIYYTTDRSIPVIGGKNVILYDGKPIHASQTVIITAVAYCDGMYRSSISSFATIIAPYAKENELSVSSDGTLTAYSGKASSFTVPQYANGTEIKKIGDAVFENTNITEVILPDSVTEIGNSAFRNCTELKTVFGRNVSVVGEYAFYNCDWLKNALFLSDLESIGEFSFYNAGNRQNIFTGSTFTLNLSKLKNIPDGAFSKSAISFVELGNLISIGSTSFRDCNQLVNIRIDYLSNMPDGCFKGCSSLTDVDISGLAYIPSGAFSCCESLIIASFADVKYVFSNAFESCVSLSEISLPQAKTVYSNAFNGCDSLSVLNLPEMTAFEDNVYTQYGSKIYLPSNLERFYAPKLIKTVSQMFETAPDIYIIGLNGAENIAVNTFKGCHNIYSLNIENITHLTSGVFNDCTIEFIDARSLVTTDDMPDNSGILLSNNFIESTDKGENMTIYGTKNTFVERYANLKGYSFIEIPLVYSEIPEYVTENSETVYILAAGFDLTYQWYWNTVPETSGGTPIDGATTPSYTFTSADSAPYYYCKITQNDLGTINEITTNIITKDTVPADYTEYNKAVEKALAVDRSLYTDLTELDAALSEDVSGRYSCEQDIVDRQTKVILDALEKLKPKVVETINLYASNVNLRFLEAERIITVFNPVDALYFNAQWKSDNENVILVSSSGYARCIGDGTATVHLTVENVDGTFTEGEIVFECKLNFWEKIAAFLIRDIIKAFYTMSY
ncbi:MAG: hypothetical protein E7516_05955 [Ruminococcaceae bacterium]|nr:hypothetical protein [Oscillospiraceae bacterium]